MNRSLLAFTFIAVAASSPLQAIAVPTAYYNPATGGIHLKNDSALILEAIAVYSETTPNVAMTDPSLYALIPGALFDAGDLPLGFTYLNYPMTGIAPFGFFIGNVIRPGTATSALTGVYNYRLHDPVTLPRLTIVEIPEPSGLALATFSLVLLLRRRQPTLSKTN